MHPGPVRPLLAVLVLCAATVSASPPPLPGSGPVRLLSVGLALSVRRAEIGSSGGMTLADPASGELLVPPRVAARSGGGAGDGPIEVLERADRRLTVVGAGAGPFESILVKPMGTARLVFAGRSYRGQILLRRDPGQGFNVINLVDVEDYLLGVLPKEMSPSAPLEALKAQAIASRTYALKHSHDFVKRGFGLKASEGSQVYQGTGAEHPRTTQAVEATRGQVLTFGGELIHAWFSAACGGRTATNRSVWGGAELPYSQSLRCTACKSFPDFRWRAQVPYAVLGERLVELGRGVGRVRGVDFLWGRDGRVVRATVNGDQKSLHLTGNEFRILSGHRSVRSLRFVPAHVNGRSHKAPTLEELAIQDIIGTRTAPTQESRTGLALEGVGYGHGVGMCQWGARQKAEDAESAERILAFYFPGVRVRTVAGSGPAGRSASAD